MEGLFITNKELILSDIINYQHVKSQIFHAVSGILSSLLSWTHYGVTSIVVSFRYWI